MALATAFFRGTDTFCPLIMGAGRPQKVHPDELYTLAHQFYWDFRRLSEGRKRLHIDKDKCEQRTEQALKRDIQLDDEQTSAAQRVVEQEIRDGQLDESESGKRLGDIQDALRWAIRLDLLQEAEAKSTIIIRV